MTGTEIRAVSDMPDYLRRTRTESNTCLETLAEVRTP